MIPLQLSMANPLFLFVSSMDMKCPTNIVFLFQLVSQASNETIVFHIRKKTLLLFFKDTFLKISLLTSRMLRIYNIVVNLFIMNYACCSSPYVSFSDAFSWVSSNLIGFVQEVNILVILIDYKVLTLSCFFCSATSDSDFSCLYFFIFQH